MSELHWVLLAVAVALLAGLFLWGKWQERRTLQRLNEALRAGVGDPLLGKRAEAEPGRRAPGQSGGRIEPRIERSEPRMDPRVEPAVQPRVEPRLAPHDDRRDESAALPDDRAETNATFAEPATPVGKAGDWTEDPLLDFVLELRCHHPFDGVSALESRGQLERLALPLPTQLAVWDPKMQGWTAPDRFGFYSEMLIAIQKAARGRVLTEIDASRFLAAVQQIAVTLDADFDVPDMTGLLQQARELDAVAARFDAQITLTLVSADGWSRDEVVAAAREAGFDELAPGRWMLRGQTGRPIVALATDAKATAATGAAAAAATAGRLALTLDVPVADPADAPLRRLFAAADALAADLKASIVDDNGRPLAAGAEGAIATELEPLHAAMRAAGVEPGSERARRLYGA